MPLRIAAFSTHPIQYMSPVYRHIAIQDDVRLTVFYVCRHGVDASYDIGFGSRFSWDVDLTQGFEHHYLSNCSIDCVQKHRISDFHDWYTRFEFDVAFLTEYRSALASQIASFAGKLDYRTVVRSEFTTMSRHGNRIVDSMVSLAKRAKYRKFDAFAYIGFDAKRHLLDHGVNEARSFYSPYCSGFTVEQDVATNLRIKTRKEYSIEDDQCVLMFSGKFIERKQPLLFADAILRLQSHPNFEKVKVVAIGSGEQFNAFRLKLACVNRSQIITPGFVNQSEIIKFYAASDVFVLPSQFDTWGVAVNEAMEFSLPTIASDMVGCRWNLIQNGCNGFIFDFRDAGDLATKLAMYIDSKELRLKHGKLGKKIVSLHSAELSANGILEACKFATDNRRLR